MRRTLIKMTVAVAEPNTFNVRRSEHHELDPAASAPSDSAHVAAQSPGFNQRIVHIADTDDSYAARLKELLEQAGLQVFVSRDLEGLRRLCKTDVPAAIVADFLVAGPDFAEFLATTRGQLPSAAIVLVANENPEASLVVKALRVGAADVVHRGMAIESVVASVGDLLDKTPASTIPTPEKVEGIPGFGTLTERERLVLGHLANGMTNKEVGLHLGISPRTVELHRAKVKRKLKVRNTTDLMRRLFSAG